MGKSEELIASLESLNLTLDDDVMKKVNLIERNLQEITVQDKIELRNILKERNLKIYWGTAITGRPHIAYYLAILKLKDFISAGCEVTILLADIHGFLDNLKAKPEEISEKLIYYEKLIKCMLAQLVDLENSNLKFVKGSSFQKNSDYVYDLYKISTFTTQKDVIRAGADVVKQSSNPLLSSFIYPNMQALDEEYLQVDAQFGGEDQRKIFMHAKTFLPKIGYKKRIHLMNYMIPGLSSEKMSSSDPNSKIDFLDKANTIKKKIRKVFCEEKNIETNSILSLFKFLIFPFFNGRSLLGCDKYDQIEKKFADGEIHPKDLKDECSDLLEEMISPVRAVLEKDEGFINKTFK